MLFSSESLLGNFSCAKLNFWFSEITSHPPFQRGIFPWDQPAENKVISGSSLTISCMKIFNSQSFSQTSYCKNIASMYWSASLTEEMGGSLEEWSFQGSWLRCIMYLMGLFGNYEEVEREVWNPVVLIRKGGELVCVVWKYSDQRSGFAQRAACVKIPYH